MKLAIGGLVVFLAVGYLTYVGLSDSTSYYVTASELVEQGGRFDGVTVRVSGQVSAGSLGHDVKSRTLRFVIAEGDKALPVMYRGIVPDTFKGEGGEVVVEGRLNSDGVFEATSILTKCPSKYVPEAPTPPSGSS